MREMDRSVAPLRARPSASRASTSRRRGSARAEARPGRRTRRPAHATASTCRDVRDVERARRGVLQEVRRRRWQDRGRDAMRRPDREPRIAAPAWAGAWRRAGDRRAPRARRRRAQGDPTAGDRDGRSGEGARRREARAPPAAPQRRRPAQAARPAGRHGRSGRRRAARGPPAVDEANPHAHAGKANGMPGVFQPPEDPEQEDPSLAPGTIAVDLRDADDHPVAGEIVTLGHADQLGRQGRQPQALSGARPTRTGARRVHGLDTASNVAYRVSSGYQGGSFAASPFQLEQVKAMHVVLHVYPVTRDIAARRSSSARPTRRRGAPRRPHPGRGGAHHLQPRAHGLAAGRRPHDAPGGVHGVQRAGVR